MCINAVSLFSGGGGMDLGFKLAGYNIIWAIDNNKNAVATYRENIGKNIHCLDINNVSLDEIPSCDIIIGGPPCQSFSLAGKRNVEDARGRLVWRYMEIISHCRPKGFVFENVTGLVSAKNSHGEKILTLLENAFREIGYTLSTKVINAADYGIPQRRKRVIIVGLYGERKFLFPPAEYSEDENQGLKKYISVEDALGDLPISSADDTEKEYLSAPMNHYQIMMRKHNRNTVTEQTTQRMSDLDKFIIQHVKPGGNYMDIPSDVPSDRIRRLQKEGGHTTCYGRLDPKKPSYTINTYFNRPNVGCNIHYHYDRMITVREAMRLQSFPDWFKIISSSKQGKNLIIGNAVPPLLAYKIAKKIKLYLEGNN